MMTKQVKYKKQRKTKRPVSGFLGGKGASLLVSHCLALANAIHYIYTYIPIVTGDALHVQFESLHICDALRRKLSQDSLRVVGP